MASPRNRKHIILPGGPDVEPYKPHPRKIDIDKAPAPASRPAHGMALTRAFESAVVEAKQRRAEAGIRVHGAVPGLYVQFESQPGVPLKLSSLEDARQGIELVAVNHVQTQEAEQRRIERATVFVPEGKVEHFVKRFEAYAKTTAKAKGERRHEDMLDPVASLRLATLRGLWTDATDVYPTDEEAIWWEVWLRRQDGGELARLMEFAALKHLDIASRRLQFDDRIVMLVRATAEQLSASLDVLNDVAEVRRAKETATVFIDMAPDEQGEWARDLLARTTPPVAGAPAVCVLDTGVTRAHPLLAASLAAVDCHTCEPAWGVHDHHGHGTEMAGLALYGDLTPVLAGTAPVSLRHVLESVKILPPNGQNRPELYGAITAEATSRVEIQAPGRQRCFSMAVSVTDERDRGQPTSWSAAVDALAAGRSLDASSQGLVYLDDSSDPVQRLFVLSAGNVDECRLMVEHLDRSDAEAVQDPAQAWNALTVGAFTDKAILQDPEWNGWQPVAPAGELSPWSTTGVVFSEAWPIKPDVVFEGGNVVKNANGEVSFPCPDLCLLSTHFQPAQKAFVLSWATSAATAQAARRTESMDEFRKRLNQMALDEDEEKPSTGGDSSEWYLGEQARNRGSLHSDILSGFAADLAERGVIAVYPVSGWWKDQPKRDRSANGARYALVVSIESPTVDADIWTPVAQQVGVPVVIET